MPFWWQADVGEPAQTGSRASSLLRLLPPVLDAIVEGSWLAVVYLVVQVLWVHGDVAMGPLELAIFAGIGLTVSRHRWGGVDPAVTVIVVAAAAGICGWLLSPVARAELAGGDLGAALAANPGGWLAAAAVLRGAAHVNPADDDAVVERVLALGLPLLAIPWILAGFATPAARAAFAEPAFVATVAFVSTALLAIAVARLETLGVATGIDWRANRPWLAVLAGVVLLMVAIAAPLAFVVGVPIEAAILGALGPLGILATAGVFVVAVYTQLVTVVLSAILGIFGLTPRPPVAPTPPPAPPANIPQGDASASQPVFVAILTAAVIIVAVVAVVAIGLVVWQWLRPRATILRRPVSEQRSIVIPRDALRISLPRRPRRKAVRHPEPRDAVAAYLALLRGLGEVPEAARVESETPAGHALRIRPTAAGGLPLDLLAADYELARYGGRALTPAEHRRALARSRRLLSRLRG